MNVTCGCFSVKETAFLADENTLVRIKSRQPDEIVGSNFGEIFVRRGLGSYKGQERSQMCQNMPERGGITPE